MPTQLYLAPNFFQPTVSLSGTCATAHLNYFEFIVPQIHGVIDFRLDSEFIHTITFQTQSSVKDALLSNVSIEASQVEKVNFASNPNNLYRGFIGTATVDVTNLVLSNGGAQFRLHADWDSNLNILIRVNIFTLPVAGSAKLPFPSV